MSILVIFFLFIMLIIIIVLLLSSCSEKAENHHTQVYDALGDFVLNKRFDGVLESQQNFKDAIDREILANQNKDAKFLIDIPDKYKHSSD